MFEFPKFASVQFALMRLALLAVALATIPVSTAAEMPVAKWETLAEEIQRTLDEERPAPTGNFRDDARLIIGNLRGAIGRSDLPQIESFLGQLAVFLRPPLRNRCDEAAKEVRALREAKEKQALEEINSLFQRATDAIRSAQKPADLDAILRELGTSRNQQQQVPSSASRAELQIEPAIQFITQWQDFLAQNAARDKKAAEATLDRIIGMNQTALLPRSEILIRRYGPPPTPTPMPTATATPRPQGEHFADVLEELKTPEDLVPVMAKLIEWANDPSRISPAEMPELQNTIRSLTLLVGAYQDYQAGLPVKLELVLNDPARVEPLGALLSPVRGQLIKLALGRYVGAPPELKIKPDEGAQEFLDRVITDAASRADFMLATRARATQNLLREGKTEVPRERSQAELFINGYNQERAGQFALAVTSYEQALASGTEIVPPKAIGERLARIKTEYPREFEEGLQAFLNPHFPTPPPGWGFPNSVAPGKDPSPAPRDRRKPVPPLVVPNPKATPVQLVSPVPQKTQPPE
jgi:hypothetical protein